MTAVTAAYLALAITVAIYVAACWVWRDKPHPEPEGRALEALARLEKRNVPAAAKQIRDVLNPHDKWRL